MKKSLLKLYYWMFPTYKRIDFKILTWDEADKLLIKNPEWKIAHEDEQLSYPFVALEIRERIYE